LLVCVALVACLWAAAPLSRVAAWIPRVVSVITLALVVVQLAVEYREIGPATDPWRRDSLPRLRRGGPLVVIGWVCGLMLAVVLLGTVAGSATFCTCYLRVHARESWRASAGVGIVLGACVWLVFAWLLAADLHAGWLWRRLVG
jgi:uncharacterized membrane protein YtjA (UPF0391 family)